MTYCPPQPRSLSPADLKRLLAEQEELRLEFKLKYDRSGGSGAENRRGEFAKDVMALANTAGRAIDDFAYLIIGAGDELLSDGTRPRQSVLSGEYEPSSLLQSVNAACIPRLEELLVQEVELEGTIYAVVVLPPCPHVLRFSKDTLTSKRTWPKNTIPVRSGEGIIVASPEDIQLMHSQRRAWSLPSSGKPQGHSHYELLYRNALRLQVQTLHLFGVDEDPDTPSSLPLSIAYVPLQLELYQSTEVPPLGLDYAEILSALPIFGNRLLIEGAAGSGKTTLLQWTVLTALNHKVGGTTTLPTIEEIRQRLFTWLQRLPPKAVPSWLTPFTITLGESRSAGTAEHIPWWQCTPFLVNLRHCANGRLPSPDELPEFIASEAGKPDSGWIKTKLQDGTALILFDGVDEVPDPKRSEIRSSIEKYMELYNNCPIILTSRPPAVQDTTWSELFFPWRVAIKPMAPVDIERFIEHWHLALASVRARRREVEVDHAAIRDVQAQVTSSSALTQLAETPLLCAAICYLHRVRRGELPRRLATLYEKLCELLVHRLDRERLPRESLQHFSPAFYKLELEDKLRLLARIAHFMVREELSSLDMDRAVAQVTHELYRLRKTDDLSPGDVLRALQERSGVLRSTAATEIEFIHNALKSYLAAGIFAEEGSTTELIQKSLNASDPDLPVLAAARGHSLYRGLLVEALIEGPRLQANQQLHEKYRSNVIRQLHIIALRAGVTGSVPERIVPKLDSLEKELLPPWHLEEAPQFAEFGERIAGRLTYDPSMTDDISAACIRTLRLIGGTKADEVLQHYVDKIDCSDQYASVHEWLAGVAPKIIEELVQAVSLVRLSFVRKLIQDWGGAVPRLTKIARHIQNKDLTNFSTKSNVKQLGLQWTSVNNVTCLTEFTNLQKLYIRGREYNLEDLPNIKKLEVLFLENIEQHTLHIPSNLRVLHIHNSQIEDYSFISEARELQEISLDDSDIVHLTPLGSLEHLLSVSMGYTNVHDVSPLSNCRYLSILEADESKVESLLALRDINLKILSLQHTAFSNSRELRLFPGLEALYVNNTELSDLEGLSELLRLRVAFLSHTMVADLQPLRELKRLEILVISHTQVRDLTPLVSLAGLRELHVDSTEVVDLTPLRMLRQLQEFHLGSMEIYDAEVLRELDQRGVALYSH